MITIRPRQARTFRPGASYDDSCRRRPKRLHRLEHDRGLVEQGHDCVVTRHESTEIPRFLQKHIDDHRVVIEPADATSTEDLRKIGEKHGIDGIVNVGGGFKANSPVPGLQGYFDMLTATFQVAVEWKVKRVTFSSTGGMYLGVQGQADEEHPPSSRVPSRSSRIRRLSNRLLASSQRRPASAP